MNIENEVRTVIGELEEFTDPERKEKAKGYYPTQFEIIGVKVPNQRKVATSLRERVKNGTPEFKIRLAKALVDTGIFECQQVAYELLSIEKKVNSTLTLSDLFDLRKGFDNWVSVDTFSGYLSGVAWREGRINDEIIMEWASSGDRWIRRSALVSTLGLNQKARGGSGDTPRTLMVCDKLKDDRDDMVVKALSWALRELSKTDHSSVEEFMDINHGVLAPRVRKEVRTKLETGRKNG